jgi:hypothetical protein
MAWMLVETSKLGKFQTKNSEKFHAAGNFT